MNSAREQILNSLTNKNTSASNDNINVENNSTTTILSDEEKLRQFIANIELVKAQTYKISSSELIPWIKAELPKLKLKNILLGTNELGNTLKEKLSSSFNVTQFEQNIENFKDELFNQIDVSITTTIGAIAATGSLILVPTCEEPRSMSLVPPVHIALLHEDKIYQDFSQVLVEQNKKEQMPTNLLLISGPSKTADIEQVLAYGVHGPKKLIVLILTEAT